MQASLLKPTVLFPVLLLAVSTSAFAQCQLRGTVTDGAGTAIPYSSIYDPEAKVGVYADARGDFTLVLRSRNETDLTTFYVSSIGYVTDTIQLACGNAMNVVLKPQEYTLDKQIEVLADRKLKFKTRKIGEYKERPIQAFSAAVLQNNYNFAQLIRIPDKFYDPDKLILINSIGLSMQTVLDDSREAFSLNILAYDENCGCPGESLLTEPLPLMKSKLGWNTAKLDNTLLQLDNDKFFIAYESYSATSTNSNHSIGYRKGRGNIWSRVPGGDWVLLPFFRGKVMLVKATIAVEQ